MGRPHFHFSPHGALHTCRWRVCLHFRGCHARWCKHVRTSVCFISVPLRIRWRYAGIRWFGASRRFDMANVCTYVRSFVGAFVGTTYGTSNLSFVRAYVCTHEAIVLGSSYRGAIPGVPRCCAVEGFVLLCDAQAGIRLDVRMRLAFFEAFWWA